MDGRLTSGPTGTDTYGNSSHPHTLTSTSAGYSAAYDAAGNMTCRAPSSAATCSGTPTGQQLNYDAEGRLTSWQDQPGTPTKTANYLYDGSGNRVAMQTTVSGTTTLTAYIGSIEEVQTTGSTTQTTTYYAVGGMRIAAAVNGTFYYFGYDALGSQVLVLNASGSMVGEQLFGPYGNQRYSTGTLPTSIGFTGQRGDSVSGLDYYVARYYDPVAGVFLSVDSVQGNEQGMNPYAYVGGNPETWSDPTGQFVISEGEIGSVEALAYLGGATTETSGSSLDLSGVAVAPPLPEETVTSGNSTYTFDPNTGNIVQHTMNVDGSQSWTGYTRGMMGYDGLFQLFDSTFPRAVNSVLLHHSIVSPGGTGVAQPGGSGARPPGGGNNPPPTTSPPPPERSRGPRMNPQDIRFTQNTCSNQGNGYTVQGNIEGLQNGSLTPDSPELGVSKVFQKQSWMNQWGKMTRNGYTGDPANLEDGQWYSLNNRRLYAFKQTGVTDAPVEDITNDPNLKFQRWQFTTENFGTDIELLGGC